MSTPIPNPLTPEESRDVATILSRRANEIAQWSQEHQSQPGSVELALTREMKRLRDLAQKLTPAEREDGE